MRLYLLIAARAICLSFMKKIQSFSGTPPVINIDHHASNDNFGQINIVNSEAASVLKFCMAF